MVVDMYFFISSERKLREVLVDALDVAIKLDGNDTDSKFGQVFIAFIACSLVTRSWIK